MEVGYIRVSKEAQNATRQQILMQDIKASGKDADRPELKEMLAFAREGGTLIVEKKLCVYAWYNRGVRP